MSAHEKKIQCMRRLRERTRVQRDQEKVDRIVAKHMDAFLETLDPGEREAYMTKRESIMATVMEVAMRPVGPTISDTVWTGLSKLRKGRTLCCGLLGMSLARMGYKVSDEDLTLACNTSIMAYAQIQLDLAEAMERADQFEAGGYGFALQDVLPEIPHVKAMQEGTVVAVVDGKPKLYRFDMPAYVGVLSVMDRLCVH